MNNECDWYPDKCKSRWFWACPDCGKTESGNCAIVKLNILNSSGWLCLDCYDLLIDMEYK